MAYSTPVKKPRKPKKDYPLFPHASGQWAKKVCGRTFYFGKWDNPAGALERWYSEKDDLFAGRTPAPSVDGLTVRELANRFLTRKRHALDSGEIQPKTFKDYEATCRAFVSFFGRNKLVDRLRPQDFADLRRVWTKRCGFVRLGNEIGRVKSVFKWAYEDDLIDRPIKYGAEFKQPSRGVLRRAKAKQHKRLFQADEINAMLGKASVPLRAMILLGINCGFGNKDCSDIEKRHLDLDDGWVDYPRPKTGIERRCKLWPETVEALRLVIKQRPKAAEREYRSRVFLTGGTWKPGYPYVRQQETKTGNWYSDDALAKEFRKLLDKLNLHRKGVAFYALRHTFATIAGAERDQVAVDFVMGHVDDSMAARYREHIDDGRLADVAERVRDWLTGG